jgi:anti-anti-sigma regulatory factor
MEARLKYYGDVAVIDIQGALVIEKTQPFRKVCQEQFGGQKVIFKMDRTTFVGSNGLQAFIATLENLNLTNEYGVKLVGAKPEFRRLLANLSLPKVEFHETEDAALKSFSSPVPVATLPLNGSDSIDG